MFRQADPRAHGGGRDAVAAAARGGDRPRRRCRPPRRCAATRSPSSAVAPASAPAVERLLIAMGFRHAGHHRTKDVQLWRHGDTHILVNHADARARAARRGDRRRERRPDPLRAPRRAAARPAAAARPRPRRGGPLGDRRARRHLGVLLPHRRATPTAGSPTSSPPARPARRSPPSVAGIDHVALSQPFDYFDEAALFYRSVLGLELQSGHELAAPEGLVRSRAARSADGSVRFALSVPLVGTGGLGAPARRVRLRRRLRRRATRCATAACRCSPCPATTTTTSRPGPTSTPALIERMRATGVLYDADGDGRRAAALLHRDCRDRACSSRSSSAAAATTATAPPTPRAHGGAAGGRRYPRKALRFRTFVVCRP